MRKFRFRTRLDAIFRYKVRSLVERNGGRVGELACSQHLRAKPMLLELLDESANEYYLFHGAHRLLAVGIANGC